LELYQGTVIAISHDRYFLDRLADKIALIKNGVFEEHLGGYSEVFEKLTTRQVEGDQIEKGKYNGTKQRDAEKIKNSAISKQKDPQNTALSKNRRMMLEKRLEEIIQEITENEQMQAELSSEISSPEIAVNRELFEAKMEKLKETEGKLDKLWTEWNEISVILENSSSY
jgi:ATPase subunit of ABC transporter with duplicated ATPase domains